MPVCVCVCVCACVEDIVQDLKDCFSITDNGIMPVCVCTPACVYCVRVGMCMCGYSKNQPIKVACSNYLWKN